MGSRPSLLLFWDCSRGFINVCGGGEGAAGSVKTGSLGLGSAAPASRAARAPAAHHNCDKHQTKTCVPRAGGAGSSGRSGSGLFLFARSRFPAL
jgi:hypothetical protein